MGMKVKGEARRGQDGDGDDARRGEYNTTTPSSTSLSGSCWLSSLSSG